MLKTGETFYSPKSENDIPHLWIVLTDPDPPSYKAVCVNITSRQTHSEATVVLQKGDHPFIKHPSVVFYADAGEKNLADLDKLIAMNSRNVVCKQGATCTAELLARVQQGLLSSPNVAKRLKVKCATAWGMAWPPAQQSTGGS